MKQIDAFETSDGERFFNEEEARSHERERNYRMFVEETIRISPQYHKLDDDILVMFLMEYGRTVGELATDPIPLHVETGRDLGEPYMPPKDAIPTSEKAMSIGEKAIRDAFQIPEGQLGKRDTEKRILDTVRTRGVPHV